MPAYFFHLTWTLTSTQKHACRSSLLPHMADNSLVTAGQYECPLHKTALWSWNKGWRYHLVSKFLHSKSECAEPFMPLGSAFGMRGLLSLKQCLGRFYGSKSIHMNATAPSFSPELCTRGMISVISSPVRDFHFMADWCVFKNVSAYVKMVLMPQFGFWTVLKKNSTFKLYFQFDSLKMPMLVYVHNLMLEQTHHFFEFTSYHGIFTSYAKCPRAWNVRQVLRIFISNHTVTSK